MVRPSSFVSAVPWGVPTVPIKPTLSPCVSNALRLLSQSNRTESSRVNSTVSTWLNQTLTLIEPGRILEYGGSTLIKLVIPYKPKVKGFDLVLLLTSIKEFHWLCLQSTMRIIRGHIFSMDRFLGPNVISWIGSGHPYRSKSVTTCLSTFGKMLGLQVLVLENLVGRLRFWKRDQSGLYSVRSDYRWLINAELGLSGDPNALEENYYNKLYKSRWNLPKFLCGNPEQAEAIACVQALILSKDLGFRKVIIEGDSLSVISKLQIPAIDRSILNINLANIIRRKSHFNFLLFLHVHRERNKAAHLFTRVGLKKFCP
ncbi:hypothetical protein F3Y22_tig00111582pilonHSYRG00426 [Hibiscus syriacus]|uniref:RNase H type-1 domain-containing protein n=1 Tax=Hibiscus syriacus TaxID=106335 RepID=A0A6A2XLK1_HIBSY|nr:hypothetical protein F3Y22_tig00111582pilonHSYRG00426 [Hibiscus syriacus]